jgi:hypothetical protein
MGDIVAIDNITLDGVLPAPGRPDEDRRDGFAHGGWAVPCNDDVLRQVLGEGMRARHALLGRHVAGAGDELVREDLCAEAVRLGRLLAELMPDEPEALGLLALMLLVRSRQPARTTRTVTWCCWPIRIVAAGTGT